MPQSTFSPSQGWVEVRMSKIGLGVGYQLSSQPFGEFQTKGQQQLRLALPLKEFPQLCWDPIDQNPHLIIVFMWSQKVTGLIVVIFDQSLKYITKSNFAHKFITLQNFQCIYNSTSKFQQITNEFYSLSDSVSLLHILLSSSASWIQLSHNILCLSNLHLQKTVSTK